MHQCINFVRRHTHGDGPSGQIQNFARHGAGHFHFEDFVGRLDFNHPGQHGLEGPGSGCPRRGVIGLDNAVDSDYALGRLFSGTNGTGVRKAVLLLR